MMVYFLKYKNKIPAQFIRYLLFYDTSLDEHINYFWYYRLIHFKEFRKVVKSVCVFIYVCINAKKRYLYIYYTFIYECTFKTIQTYQW